MPPFSFGDVPNEWPLSKGKPKKIDKFTLEDRERVLQAGAEPPNFEKLYEPVRTFRNYMHQSRAYREDTDRSIRWAACTRLLKCANRELLVSAVCRWPGVAAIVWFHPSTSGQHYR